MIRPNQTTPEQQPAALAADVLHLEHVDPDREQIHRLVGLKPGRANHQRWFDLVDQMLGEVSHLTRPRGVYRIDEITLLKPGRIELASGAIYRGAVGAFLEHSTKIATFVVTIGSALERLSRRWLRNGKIMQGTIADAIASETAEGAAERMRQVIRDWARRQGQDVTPSFSPGYCGMHVRQQVPLFESLPVRRINVRLTPSCLMLPMKSVSGLVGIGPKGEVSPDRYPCEVCEHPHCPQRRAAVDPALVGRLRAVLAQEGDD